MTMREQEAAARLDDVSTFGLDTIALIRAGDQAIPNALLPRIHDVASDFDRCRSTGRIALDRLGKSSSAVSRATLTAPSQRAIACNARRHARHSRQSWHFGICKL